MSEALVELQKIFPHSISTRFGGPSILIYTQKYWQSGLFPGDKCHQRGNLFAFLEKEMCKSVGSLFKNLEFFYEVFMLDDTNVVTLWMLVKVLTIQSGITFWTSLMSLVAVTQLARPIFICV